MRNGGFRLGIDFLVLFVEFKLLFEKGDFLFGLIQFLSYEG